MEDQFNADDIDDDFNGFTALNEGYELGMARRPKYDMPVTMLIFRVNGHRVDSSNTDANGLS
jgi:hypothetical protein